MNIQPWEELFNADRNRDESNGIGFSFLIGKISTDNRITLEDEYRLFQFLDRKHLRKPGVIGGFQFLLGKISTCGMTQMTTKKKGFNSS